MFEVKWISSWLGKRKQTILHDGADLVVRQHLEHRGDTLVISFAARDGRAKWRGKPASEIVGPAETFLNKNKIPSISFYNRWNHWWQTPEMDEVIDKLHRERILSKYKTIVTYGMSMGGYGALMFSERLGAHRVLAGVPQYSIDGEKIPTETRWGADRERIVLQHDDMDAGLIKGGEVMVLFDPLFRADCIHVDRLRRHRAITALPVPFAVHGPGGLLKDMGILSSTVVALLLNGSSGVPFRSRVRSTRRLSPIYMGRLAQALTRRAGARSRAAAAEIDSFSYEMLEQRVAVDPRYAAKSYTSKVAARLVMIRAKALGAAGHHRDVVELLRRWIPSVAKPDTLLLHLTLGAALAEIGDKAAAAAKLRAAIALPVPVTESQMRVLLRLLRDHGSKADVLAVEQRHRALLLKKEALSLPFAEILLRFDCADRAVEYFRAARASSTPATLKLVRRRVLGLAAAAGAAEARALLRTLLSAPELARERDRLEKELLQRFEAATEPEAAT